MVRKILTRFEFGLALSLQFPSLTVSTLGVYDGKMKAMIIETKGRRCAVVGISTTEVTATTGVMTGSATTSSRRNKVVKKKRKEQTTR